MIPLEECEDSTSCGEWENDDPELMETLKKLRPLYRTILYMYYYEGYKIREIARILDLRENTVSSGLTRGRKKLRDALTEGEDGSWGKSIAICSPK